MKTVIARPGLVLRWFAGPLIWAAHFLVVYGSESLACTRGGSHALVVIVATIAALAALAATTSLAESIWTRPARRGVRQADSVVAAVRITAADQTRLWVAHRDLAPRSG